MALSENVFGDDRSCAICRKWSSRIWCRNGEQLVSFSVISKVEVFEVLVEDADSLVFPQSVTCFGVLRIEVRHGFVVEKDDDCEASFEVVACLELLRIEVLVSELALEWCKHPWNVRVSSDEICLSVLCPLQCHYDHRVADPYSPNPVQCFRPEFRLQHQSAEGEHEILPKSFQSLQS